MSIPSTIYLYRIVHINNLEFILKSGKLYCPNHELKDKNYIGIGERELILTRDTKMVPLDPYGTFRDYVTFYFGYRSVMLYAIHHGYDVTQIPQEDIIYLVSSIDEIERSNCRYVFTDGHASAQISQWYNQKRGLNDIDWSMVNSKMWNNTEADPDRKRRKQAEFLVHMELPFSAIICIVVFNEKSLDFVQDILTNNKIDLPVQINKDFYY